MENKINDKELEKVNGGVTVKDWDAVEFVIHLGQQPGSNEETTDAAPGPIKR